VSPTHDIVLEDVTFSYDGVPVLEGASLAVPTRDFACVVGPNGGGKTTLLKLLLGLLTPQKGTISVLGRSPVAARSHVGYMPQSADIDPSFPVNVLDVVLMGRLQKTRPFGPYSPGDKAAALRCLEEVDLAGLRARPFGKLSGGQRQRVLIARALACEPKLLLLDEPTANLDAQAEGEFYELLRTLNEQMTVVVVSHDLSFVSAFVQTVICVGIERTIHVHDTTDLADDRVHTAYGDHIRMVLHNSHDRCDHEPEEPH